MTCGLSLSGLVVLLPAALAAQQPGDTVELKPVVVTATRLPTPADAVTASVTVLSGAELRRQGIRTVFDALRAVPGAAVVQAGSYGAQTSLFLRGGESDYVRVLVDGVPVNQPGGAFDFAHLTTDNVERIEIVRGPASVLYGSDAVTGVVQIFTRRGTGGARAEASVRAGTYGAALWEARVSGGSAAASYSLALSRFTSDGLYAFNSAYRNTVLSGLARVVPDDRTDATFTIRYGDNVYHFPTDGAGNPVDHNQFNYGSGPTVGFELGHYFAPRWETRLLVGVNETDGGFDNRPDSPSDTLGFYGFQSLDHIRRMSADARENVHLSSVTVLTGGAVVEQESQRSFTESQSQFGGSSGQIDVRRHNAAYYAQAVTALGGRLFVNAGVRLEDNERFGTFATYRVGAAYRLPTGTRLRLSAGTGFKEPTFFENFATGFARGNPHLQPERSRSWEFGLEQEIAGGRALVSATYFDQRFRDLIDYSFAAMGLDSSNYFNIAGALANGTELSVGFAPGHGVTAAVTYSYLYTKATAAGFDSTSGATFAPGQPLLRRPRNAVTLDLGYRVGALGSFHVGASSVGERADQDFSAFPFPRVTLAGYTRVDAAAEWEVLREAASRPGFALVGRVENLFDRRYEEVKNFPARRRTLLFGGQLRFGT